MVIPQIVSNEELIKLCREWQAVLRLQDWIVQVRFVRHFELNHTEQGNCSSNCMKKMAQIRIVTPEDYNNPEWQQDVEKTLVHELLHLYSAPFTDLNPPHFPLMLEEQMVDGLATAFIRLKRDGWSVQSGRLE